METCARTMRPDIGTKLFMSFMISKPVLVTVVGYHTDQRFTSEQIEYVEHVKGKSDSSSLGSINFYPDAAVDSQFVYIVMAHCVDHDSPYEEQFFFNLERAFAYLQALEAGVLKPRLSEPGDEYQFSVVVERI